MTQEEIRVLAALQGVTFVPGCGPKRFVRDLGECPQSMELTSRQKTYLWSIAQSYRRQIPSELHELIARKSEGRGINSRTNKPIFEPKTQPAADPVSWRGRLQPIIRAVILANAGKPLNEVRKALREEWRKRDGLFQHHPYKIWCSEARRQLDLDQWTWTRPKRGGRRKMHPATEPDVRQLEMQL